jgi:glycosyltransferase involved in cell wall biosynthesis
MISILIPVFNTNAYSLIQELSFQLNLMEIEGEILVYDDFSDLSFKVKNKSIVALKNVFYKELEKNVGRIGIRRLLAENARFDWLLFIDGDSTVINKNYLSNYLEAINTDSIVYAGGTVYQSQEPAVCIKRLHWKYGREREVAKNGRDGFHTNNFCMRKDIFLELNFPHQLSGYGHEDTWMQIELDRMKEVIYFIDNPVLHNGLEDATVFLDKTQNALKNLLSLAKIVGEDSVRKRISLYNVFFWLRKLGLSKLIESNLKRRKAKIENNLHSCNPSLFQFDLYRLYYLIKLSKEEPAEK